MSAKAVVGIVLGIVLLLVVAYYAIPNPGKDAIKREQFAVNGVASWRIRMEISQNGRLLVNRTHVAICPDKESITEMAPDGYAQYIRLGEDIYYRKNNMHWAKGTPGPDLFFPIPTPRPCLTNPGEPSSQPAGGAEEMRLALESDITDGHIAKGEVEEVKGSPCRVWTVARFTPRNQLGNYTTCIGESDNLPRYIRAAGERFNIYFEWDPALVIDPPDLAAPINQMPVMP